MKRYPKLLKPPTKKQLLNEEFVRISYKEELNVEETYFRQKDKTFWTLSYAKVHPKGTNAKEFALKTNQYQLWRMNPELITLYHPITNHSPKDKFS